MSKNLSNPFSTGGGGPHFEAHVQSSFVVLMLSGGSAPCLPCWPISEINLQGKIEGFDTDDLIVTVKNDDTGEQRKMLAQVKHSIAITNSNTNFGEVIQAAWNDFNNPEVFSKGKDVISLITGSLSGVDSRNVQWLLTQAKRTKNVVDFFRNVKQANFSPPKSHEKLEVINHHLKIANDGNSVSSDELYDFLNHFHILVYDLGEENGSILSLLFSHISQSQQQNPRDAWSKCVDFVQNYNQSAGTITPEKLPEYLVDEFKQKQKTITNIPDEFKTAQDSDKTNWASHPDATYLALLNFVGAWDEKNESDIEALKQLIDIEYETWIGKAREILQYPDSPLREHNGVWSISNRTELWCSLGSRILDQNLNSFKALSTSVLSESDPALDLPVEERYATSIYGKVLNYSQSIRKGIAEGLAILGNNPEVCNYCSQGKTVETADLAIRTIFNNSDWYLWCSLNRLLPALAEASPDQFLSAVEDALRRTPCPFKQIFGEENNNIITGDNYMTGLLWALEGLAWDENYIVRVCVILGELASHDSGGQWANRPSSSLATILLPWFPQTMASIEKQRVAVQAVIQECLDSGWELLLQLLPSQRQVSDGSYKPVWRNPIPNDFEIKVSEEHDYWPQVSFYSDLAVETAGHNIARLSDLIDQFGNLPKTAIDQLIDVLSSPFISDLHEEQQMLIWDRLVRITRKHRRFADAKWAFPDEILTRIEEVADRITPSSPFNRNQHLFSESDFNLCDENNDYEAQRKKLNDQRDTAIQEIFQQGGIDYVIQFSDAVSSSSYRVGHALGAMSDPIIGQALLPNYLDSKDKKTSDLISAYIWRRHYINGWGWCDGIDKSEWSTIQIGCFLASLPFTKDAWDRAAQWLEKFQDEYWTRANANFHHAGGDIDIAIDLLFKHDRPRAVLNLLTSMRIAKKPFRVDQCVQALLDALSSNEPVYDMEKYHIVELIKHLQSEPSVAQDDLFKIEWTYLPLLDRHGDAIPKLLENTLTNDPEFFCEEIRLIYRSEKEGASQKKSTEEAKANASKAWKLLYDWKTPPGTQDDGSFNADAFTEWLLQVKAISSESGHLGISLIHVGGALAYSPADPGGLWIHKTIAAALNAHDADEMRRGYRTGLYNKRGKRGMHYIDPTGTPEKALAEQFYKQAEEVENAGFQRLATSLRGLSDAYNNDAERIISDHKNEQKP